MQFCISAAVAAIAMYAGQAMANCTPYARPGHNVAIHPCVAGKTAGLYYCGDTGAAVLQSGSTLIVRAGSGTAYIGAFCRDDSNTYTGVQCMAGSWGNIYLDCHGGPFILDSYQPPKA
ncbi:hypothetical protein E4U43_006174 [Claviceps pusilla]|uniref:Cyanovirin-N domain-containing protein n=1 Tax=Claviceps pusilla TaxID=123648 RepID=A0A9P7N3A6_9HYPO|nr:hypothetical protein E4U43_006174 [Claviceps pusilla]